MTRTIHRRYTYMVLVSCSLLSHSAIGQTVSVSDGELHDLARSASRPERDVWWPAVERLGTLASDAPALRDEIWRRAHVNTLGMKFVRVEPGTFTMGPDIHRLFDLQKAHKVKITKSFYMGVTEVTNQQFTKVFPKYRLDTKHSPDADSPAVRIKWKQAAKFCKLLSEREGATYRLPTEAEWEYACRAGRTTLYSFGVTAAGMSEHGWCMGDRTKAAPVAMLQPNDWGIYDMHGNVFEWVGDYFSFSDDYYASCAAKGTVEDPKGPESGWSHVLRSTGWQNDNPWSCTCTARLPLPRFNKKPFAGDKVGIRETIGFRMVREASESEAR